MADVQDHSFPCPPPPLWGPYNDSGNRLPSHSVVPTAIQALERVGVYHVESLTSECEDALLSHVGKIIWETGTQEPFYLMDVGRLVRLFQAWREALPRVTPYYAVKCSPSPALISVLAALGANFDCASKAEISLVTSLGVEPERIIFANPCKMVEHIKYASSVGVHLTTFDCTGELRKIKLVDPEAKLLLRLRADDTTARCPLGVKYGALRSEVTSLLIVANELGLEIVGVAFHVGSGAADAGAYVAAIAEARHVFDEAEGLGNGETKMSILDLGGGLTAGSTAGSASPGTLHFSAAARAINEALSLHFPPEMGVSIIAEPGRYFAESPSTLATNVFGYRTRGDHREYWINDGLYGSLNCVLYDHAILCPRTLKNPKSGALFHGGKKYDDEKCVELNCKEVVSGETIPEDPMFCSTVFGPTCDGFDTVLRDTWLPQMSPGDWIVFPNMGAYSAAAGSSFNGFSTGEIPTHYVFSTLTSKIKMTA